jgi:rod shape-determining protein MreB
MNHGILLTGGTSLLRGIDKLIESSTGLEVNIADDPINTVVRGEGIILENFDGMKVYLLSTITNN